MHKSVTTEILVIGGDGIIGSGLAAQFRSAGNRVMYTSRRNHKIPSDCLQLDLENVDDLCCTAEVVIICAAIHDYKTCERYPNQSRRLNVDNTVKLATNLYSRGAHIIFLSTSGVFNGTEPGFRAETPRLPQRKWEDKRWMERKVFLHWETAPPYCAPLS